MKQIAVDTEYIGVNDLDIDLFEGQYKVPDGLTYNSYLIIDDKIAILDTCDRRKKDEFFINLENALKEKANGKNPDYLIVSHLEEDHSGSIQEILEKYPNMKVVLNPTSANMFKQFFDIDISNRTVIVKEGDTLNLGKHTLKFILTPMVHWPEVMFIYDEYTKALFTADAFGKFGAFKGSERIVLTNTSNNLEKLWDDEARRYYINICGKYGMQVQNALKKLENTEIKVICPLHGTILSEDLKHYIELYDKWSKYEAEEEGTLIVYGSIHGNTEAAAKKLYEKLEKQGKKCKILDIARCDMSEAISLSYKYSKLAIVCVTYNMSIFPNMNLFLTLLKEKNYQNRKLSIVENGSWAPNAANVIKSVTKEMKNIEIVEPIITIKTKLNQETEKELDKLANVL